MSLYVGTPCRCRDCRGEDEARAAEAALDDIFDLTPSELEDLLGIADQAITVGTAHEGYWRAVRRAILDSEQVLPPAPVGVEG